MAIYGLMREQIMEGLKPLLNEKGERVSFISWFTEWLDEAVQM